MTPTPPSHRCATCKDLETTTTTKYRCRWNLCFVKPSDTCPCKPSHWEEGIPKKIILKVTNTQTGKVFQHENTNHAWNDLAADFNADLVRSDIECLLTDGETWYMLDECGNWAYLPAWYKVEEVR